jgi:hypothetical protein
MKKLILTLILLSIPLTSYAAILEVGSGKTYAKIQTAVDLAQPGDTVLVYPGTYNDSNLYSFAGTNTSVVYIKNSGTQDNPISIKAAASGVVIDGGGTVNNCFWGRDLSYVTLNGFECRNVNVEALSAASGAIYIWKGSHIQIVNNYIHDITATDPENKAAIMVNSIDSLIKNNTIRVSSVGIAGGMSGYLFVRNTIENNIIDGNNGAANGMYISQNTNDWVITGNYVFNYKNSGIQVRDCVNATISRNVIYHAVGDQYGNKWAMNLRDWTNIGPGQNNEDEHHKIWNNVIDDCNEAFALTRQNDDEIKNNIIINCKTIYLDTRWYQIGHGEPSQNLYVDYNIYFNYINLYSGFSDDGYGATTYTDGGHNKDKVNPQFIATGNRPSPFYKLISSSPAINAGDPSFNVPVSWGIIDIGRYEWTSTGKMPDAPIQ